jgi:hypothetical protein
MFLAVVVCLAADAVAENMTDAVRPFRFRGNSARDTSQSLADGPTSLTSALNDQIAASPDMHDSAVQRALSGARSANPTYMCKGYGNCPPAWGCCIPKSADPSKCAEVGHCLYDGPWSNQCEGGDVKWSDWNC